MRRGKRESGASDIAVIRESKPDLQRQAAAILFVLGYTGPEKHNVMQDDVVLEQLNRYQPGLPEPFNHQADKKLRNDTSPLG